jgi:hypothetical protein
MSITSNFIRRHGPIGSGIGVGLALLGGLSYLKHTMYRKQQDEKICLLYRSTLEKAGCIGADEVSLKETAMCAKLVDFLIEKEKEEGTGPTG